MSTFHCNVLSSECVNILCFLLLHRFVQMLYINEETNKSSIYITLTSAAKDIYKHDVKL